MKKSLFLFAVLFTIVFAGCKKDDPVLDRVKFIGSWTGTETMVVKIDGQTVSTETEAATEVIDAGVDANQVLFAKNTDDEIKATISGSSLTIPNQTKFANYDGTVISAEFSGQGILSSNNVLTLTYNMDFKDGTLIVVTATLNKN